jgi:hypothetical protein
VTDCIDAPLNATKLASGDSVLDRPSPESEPQELPPADDPVLSLRQIPDLSINRTKRRFSRRDMENRRLIRHGVDPPWIRRTDGALNVTKRATKKRLQPAGTASGFDPLK